MLTPSREPHSPNFAFLSKHDAVLVRHAALAERYAPHGRVAVLPNLVPARYLDVTAAPHDGTVIGWGGNLGSLNNRTNSIQYLS